MDFVPAAPSDQLTTTVSIFMLDTDALIVRVRVKETPPDVTFVAPVVQLFDPPDGTAPAFE
jgi:hypothetical protein